MRVELKQVGKRFGRVTALRDIDLALPAGSKVALIGPNGSGKTTLIRVLLGLVEHTGTVELDGGRTRRELAHAIAYVPQIAPRTATPVGQIVRAICDLRGIEREAVGGLASQLALPIDTIAKQPFRALSGGSKQKLLIACALAQAPELLILDEPTASLDARARAKFFELQHVRAGAATMILCSHRLDELRPLVDRVIALEDGAVAYDGPADAYLARHTKSRLEVRLRGSDSSWLVSRGFAEGAAGWWTASVDADDKVALVAETVTTLGPAIADLVIRDLDVVEIGGGA